MIKGKTVLIECLMWCYDVMLCYVVYENNQHVSDYDKHT